MIQSKEYDLKISYKITISPLNGQFMLKDNNYLLGKSDPNNDEFDILLLVHRNIKEFSIPENIKIISSYAFSLCKHLSKVEIPANSNLQIIEKGAFSSSAIEEFLLYQVLQKYVKLHFLIVEI